MLQRLPQIFWKTSSKFKVQHHHHAQTTSLHMVNVLVYNSIVSWVNHSVDANYNVILNKVQCFYQYLLEGASFLYWKNKCLSKYDTSQLIESPWNPFIFKTLNFTESTKTNAYKMLIKQTLMLKFISVCW